jgi:hypothetical protein
MYECDFRIEPVHEHCRIVSATGEFEDILARAANDHLGAYSKELIAANTQECEEIKGTFTAPGVYFPYQLLPGEVPGCAICGDYDNHLFCNWFYAVAWDWCFFLTWPDHNLLWMGCLTDTD